MTLDIFDMLVKMSFSIEKLIINYKVSEIADGNNIFRDNCINFWTFLDPKVFLKTWSDNGYSSNAS